jgi:hypothetical protein
MDQKEQKRKRALIVFQIFIYGYLLTMFGIQLYMSFAGRWELNLPLCSTFLGAGPARADGRVSLEDHHEESHLAQRGPTSG